MLPLYVMQDGMPSGRSRLLAICIVLLTIGVSFGVSFATPALHILDLRFNPFAILSATTATISLGLFLYFVSKAARTEERIWLCLYLAISVLYTVSELMQRISGNVHAALFWYYVAAPIVVLPVAIYLFALSYTNQSERRYPGTIAILVTGSLLLGFFYTFTNIIFVSDPRLALILPWGYDFRRAIGPAVGVSLLWNDGLIILALARLMSFRHHSRNPILRSQSLLFIMAISIPLGTGVITNVALPIVGFPGVLPIGTIMAIPSELLLIYGLLRYQLLTLSPTLFGHTVLAIMREAVVATDDRFNIIWLNSKAETLFLRKTAEHKQLALPAALTDSTRPTFDHAFKAPGADTVDIDHVDIRQPHEAVVPVRLTASRLHLGSYNTWVMILSDITTELHTRRLIEHEVLVRTRELHEARAYLIASINSLEQGFILVNRRGEVELTNATATDIFHIKHEPTEKDKTHKPPLGILKMPAWNIDFAKVVNHVLESRHARDLHAETKTGSFYDVYITPVLEGDDILGAAIILEDVTEQKIMDRSKDEFFSIASHELRTPLTAIRGNMSMVQRYFSDDLNQKPDLRQLVDDSHSASIRLISIVNDFLDSSRLEQGKMQFTFTPVVIAPLVHAVVSDLQLIVDTHHNTVSVGALDQLPAVKADEERLRQILYNLISNATTHNEHCTISVNGRVDAHKVEIRVTDTGTGISPEHQKLLFHKFQQAGENILTRNDTKGTGLGLYISKLLTTNMHGTIELEHSEVGKGSTFILALPIASEPGTTGKN